MRLNIAPRVNWSIIESTIFDRTDHSDQLRIPESTSRMVNLTIWSD